jgi:formylglycine-generating enzyme
MGGRLPLRVRGDPGGAAMRRALALLAVCAGACAEAPVRPELVVIVDTDAHVPRFGERLRVELVAGDGSVCPGCVRVFDVADPAAWPHSFGVVPDGLAMVRLRLYRARDEGTEGGSPPNVTIDRVAVLPDVASGIRTTRVTLAMACAGSPADPVLRTTCVDGSARSVPAPPLEDDTLGDDTSIVGTWPGALGTPCTGSPASDEVCVRGGAYYMGDDRLERSSPAHLATVSPFFLDVDEVAVGRFRDWFHAVYNLQPTELLLPEEGRDGCTMPANLDDDRNDALPVVCIARELAAEYCAYHGKRLARESEWEWAAVSRDEERFYPWGDDPFPRCSEIVLARSHVVFEGVSQTFGDTSCTFPENAIHAQPIASGPRDVSRDGARDLGGNASEWVSDVHAPYDSSCWTAPDLGPSPECTSAPEGAPPRGVARGGSWLRGPEAARGAERRLAEPLGLTPDIGFRCARDDVGGPPPTRPAPPPFAPDLTCEPPAALWRLRDARTGASGIYSNVYLPGFVTDDDPSTSWFAEPGSEMPWIELVLPFAVELASVEIVGTTGTWETGSDFYTGRVELYGDSSDPLRMDSITLDTPSADGLLTYDARVLGVRRVRFVGESWQNMGLGLFDSPGIGELHPVGYCPADIASP